VLGFLRSLRAQGSELRKRVTAYNDAHPAPGEQTRVVTYMGQAVLGAETAGGMSGAVPDDDMAEDDMAEDDMADLDEEARGYT
jgi:hypothetical protein